MSKTPINLERELAATLEGLATANHVSVALILAALRYPAIWEVIGGWGTVDARTLSSESKAELHTALSDILSGIMSKVKEGDPAAAAVAARVAIQRAVLR
jgi:hypothetical protein